MKIGFIGPGKVGVSLGRYFTNKGIELSGFYGRNANSTKEAANITKSKFYHNIKDIIEESHILFITTPDDIISIIDNEFSKFDLNNKSVCHTSGSLKSNVLYNAKRSGALIYSIHPIFPFSSKYTHIDELNNIYFSIEGDDLKDSLVIDVINTIGNKYFTRNEEDSSTYHLANVFVSNLTLSLINIGTNYLRKLGLNEEDSLNALKPLIKGNIDSICNKGFADSLTGPITRGDISTIEKHLSVLKAEDQEVYKKLSLNLLNLVALKENKDENILRDEQKSSFNMGIEIENIFNNSKNHLEIYNLLKGVD